MNEKCSCDEAKVYRQVRGTREEPRKSAAEMRFHSDPDPDLSAVAAAAHDCVYVRSRNAKIKTAEEGAFGLTRAELPGEKVGSPKWDGVHTKHFHAEMARLNGTPNYIPVPSVCRGN